MAYCPPTLGDLGKARAVRKAAPATAAAQRQPVNAGTRPVAAARAIASAARQPVTGRVATVTAQKAANRYASAAASRSRAAATTAATVTRARAARATVVRAAASVRTPHRQPSTPGAAEVGRARAILRASGATAVQRSASRNVLRRAKASGQNIPAAASISLPSTILRDAAASGPVTAAVRRTARREAARMDSGSTGNSPVPSVAAATAPSPQEAADAAAFGTGQPDANVAAETAGGGGVSFLSNPKVLLGVAAVVALTMLRKRGR